MITSFDSECKELTIRFTERSFDLNLTTKFKNSYYSYVGREIDLITIDLATVSTMDWAAIAALVKIRKDFRDRVPCQLTNTTPTIKNIFKIMGMDKRFRVY